MRQNAGTPGIDGISVDAFPAQLVYRIETIGGQLLDRSYRPAELDWELEERGLRFVRYADDCKRVLAQPAGRVARLLEHHGHGGRLAEAEGQPRKKRGGSPMGAQAARVQLHARKQRQAAHRAQGAGDNEGAHPRTDDPKAIATSSL